MPPESPRRIQHPARGRPTASAENHGLSVAEVTDVARIKFRPLQRYSDKCFHTLLVHEKTEPTRHDLHVSVDVNPNEHQLDSRSTFQLDLLAWVGGVLAFLAVAIAVAA